MNVLEVYMSFYRNLFNGNLLKVRKFLEPQFVHSKKHLTSSAEANMRRVLGPHLDAMNSEVCFFALGVVSGDFSV